MNQEMKQIYQQVKELLIKSPHLRDSDNLLISTIWFHQLGKQTMNSITAYEFLKLMNAGTLVNQHSISRARRMVQEDCIELRGKKYKKRKEKQVEIRNEFAKR